ncbi:MAG: HU family DNA-binding protein [Thiovulaceae bacterium]|nr:HU family DNA-binding protein [Sulfurimonadaceae bacterium]
MNKAQFVELVQKDGNYKTKIEAEAAINSFTESVTEALAAKESVTLVGFGTFMAVDVPEKSGIVPGTDKTYTKAAHASLKFKAGQTLKDIVATAKI